MALPMILFYCFIDVLFLRVCRIPCVILVDEDMTPKYTSLEKMYVPLYMVMATMRHTFV